MWPLVLMGVQMGLQMYGQAQANAAQADAEAKNAWYYRQQAAFAESSTQRELRIQERQQKRLRGEQVVGFASSGVDVGSGSALDFLVDQESDAIEERAAIRSEGDMRVQLALYRGEAADATTRTLRSSSYNNTQTATTLLGGAKDMAAYATDKYGKK